MQWLESFVIASREVGFRCILFSKKPTENFNSHLSYDDDGEV
jgi:hypothetical protein